MRDVNYGWLLRYVHANGASMFFLAVYIHMFRGLYYGSYKAPREVLWILGVIIFLLMMATAFMGYVLPWGQMSFWARDGDHQPVLGDPAGRRRDHRSGCGAASRSTSRRCNRFFSLHYLLPFVIAGVVVLHVWALHVPGQNNPTGVDVKSDAGHACRSPLLHDEGRLRAGRVPDPVRAGSCSIVPNYLGHPDNYIPGQPAADAGAHRARMVLPAVLRDPARDSRPSSAA